MTTPRLYAVEHPQHGFLIARAVVTIASLADWLDHGEPDDVDIVSVNGWEADRWHMMPDSEWRWLERELIQAERERRANEQEDGR